MITELSLLCIPDYCLVFFFQEPAKWPNLNLEFCIPIVKYDRRIYFTIHLIKKRYTSKVLQCEYKTKELICIFIWCISSQSTSCIKRLLLHFFLAYFPKKHNKTDRSFVHQYLTLLHSLKPGLAINPWQHQPSPLVLFNICFQSVTLLQRIHGPFKGWPAPAHCCCVVTSS